MGDRLGENLMRKSKISESQLAEALELQRARGGRLGDNLVELGYLSEDELTSAFEWVPRPPRSVKDTGINLEFLTDLVVKHILFMGEFGLGALAERIKLPVLVLRGILDDLRKNKFVEVKGMGQVGDLSYRFVVSERGKERGAKLLEVSRYVGPAPVDLEAYCEAVRTQTIKSILVSPKEIETAFSEIVVRPEVLKRLGPAISSGRALFVYGPPGNGKTTIAEAIGEVLPGEVYIPYSILVHGEIINLFDSVVHVPSGPEASSDEDRRWVRIRRPVVIGGGELTLESLDLNFNPIAKFYDAPFQMRANNGLLVVDDFGRQLVNPQALLNRWIVPLERRIDFLTLHTGVRFQIPFDLLVVFATNIEPSKLVDEAFLRRMRYKIRIDHPTLSDFRLIFERVCRHHKIEFREEAFNHLLERFYTGLGVDFNACHPRDLVEHIVEDARYQGRSPEMTPETLAAAWECHFVEM
jgi:hypothetical protein